MATPNGARRGTPSALFSVISPASRLSLVVDVVGQSACACTNGSANKAAAFVDNVARQTARKATNGCALKVGTLATRRKTDKGRDEKN